MLSVPPEVAANAVFQAAPSWSTRPDPSAAKDVFGALVSQNTPSKLPPAPPPSPSQPPQPSSQAAPPPASPRPADNSPPANSNANNNTPASTSNADSGNAANGNDPSNANANAAGTGNNANGQAGGASQPTTSSSSSGTAKSTGQKSQAPQGDATSTTVDPAVLLTQQAALVATTPTPVPVAVAVAISVSTPPASSPTQTPSSGGPTAPLAIAAAGIAATSQTLASQPGSPVQLKSGPDGAGAANAPVQANGADSSAVAAALTGTVAAAAPVTAKATQAKTSATTPSADNATTGAAPVDPSSPGTATGFAQNAATLQAATGGKTETTTAAPQGIAGAATDAAASTPAVSAHDRAAAASTAHTMPDLPDPGAQVAASVQPQLNSASSLTQASNLTVTAASNGPVPLSGVALQIAANVKSGKSNFDIRLDPADLGRIDVRVQIDQNGQVTSHLTVEKPETLSMLQQDAPQLQQALNDAGLKTGGGGLQFSLRDQSSSSGQNSGSGSNPNAQQLIISDEDAVPAVIAGRSYGRSLGSTSGVDIRV